MFNKIRTAMDKPITWGDVTQWTLIGFGIDAAFLGGLLAYGKYQEWKLNRQIETSINDFCDEANGNNKETEEEG